MKSPDVLIISRVTKGTSSAACPVYCNLSIPIRTGLVFLIMAAMLLGSLSAAHADSKIVVAGTADWDFGVVRYNSDGSLDTTLNPGGLLPPYTEGMVTTEISGNDQGYAVALQADGKIVVAGYSGNTDFAVTRYNADGSLDTATFNPTGAFGGPPNSPGMVTTAIGDYDYGYAVAIQTDGKIVVAGTVSVGGQDTFAVARYNSDGDLDDTFDGDGIVSTIFGAGTDDRARAVAIQTDGKIVVAGSSNTDFAVARYNSDGSLDDTFDGDGRVTTDFGSSDYGFAVTIQDDDRIVVAGKSNDDFALARYNSAGSLDNTFDGDGKLTTPVGTGIDEAQGVALQSDGRIVAAGRAYVSGSWDFGTASYNSNGSPDNTFDSDGIVTTHFGGTSGEDAYALALQSDGKIVVAGTSNFAGNYDFAIARYNLDGSLDDTFDSDGIVTTAVSGSGTDTARGIALQTECESEDWWDPAYAYSRQLTIDAADYGYSMKLVLTGADAADIYSKCLASGDDFRVAWYNGCVWFDLDRDLESFTSSNITVWFRIQEPGGWAGGLSDYYLYYGNSSPAAVKADKAKIYDLWDDFDNADNWTPFTEEGYHASPTAFVDGDSVSIPASTLTTLATLSTSFPAGNNFVIAVVQVENAAIQGVTIPANYLYLERVGGPTLMSNYYQIDTTTTGPDMQKWYVLMGMDTGAGLNPSYAVKTMVSLAGVSGEAKILAINGVTGEEAQAAPSQIQTSETILTTLTTSLPVGDNIVLAIFESENTASNSGYEITNARLKADGATLAENQYSIYLGASGTTCSKQVHFIVALHSGAPANPTYTATGISTNKKILGGAKIVAFSITSMTGLSAAYNDGTSTSIGTSETVINTLSTSFDAGKEVVVIASEQFAAQVGYARSISSTLNKLRNDETGDQVVNQYTLSFPGQNFRDHGRGFGLLNKFTSVPANPQYHVKATASDLDLAGESKILALAVPGPTSLPIVSADGTNLTIYHTQAMKHGVFHNSFTTSNSYGFAIKTRSKKSDNTGDPYHGVSGWYHTQDQYGPDAAGPHFYAGETSTAGNRYVLSNGTETDADWEQTDSVNPLADADFHVYETFVKTDGTMNFIHDGATCFPSGGGYSSADTTLTSGRVCIVNEGAGSSLSSQYDWILVRKFVESEPSVTAGTETTPGNSAPTAPTIPYSNNATAQSGQTNPTGITDPTPAFSAIYNDPNSGDIANKYRLEVNTASDFGGTVMWDSGASGASMSDTTAGNRCPDITYAGTDLADDTQYFWRITFWDDENTEGAVSATQNFTTGTLQTETTAPWYNTDWQYRKHLRIDSSRVAGDFNNFPVVINTTDADWIEDEQPTPGHVAQTDGGDILFTASDGTTKLDHEIETYDPSTGELVAWVEVPSLSGSKDTGLYIYYGNTSLDPGENQWNAAKVWDSTFREVFHLHEATGTLYDSTGSCYTGTAGAQVTQGVAGKISNAVEFDGTENSHVTLADGSMAADQTFTFSAWVRADTLPDEWQAIVHKGRDSNDDWQGLWVYGSGRLTLGWEADGGGGNVDGSMLSAGKWYYVAGTYDGTDRRLYLNGALDADPSPSDPHDTSIDEPTQIGEDYPNGFALDGIVDEVRISNIARPAEWIQTEYNNQRAPAAFYTVGIEEQYGTGADPFNNGWQYSKKITLLASEVAADLTNFPVLINTTHEDWKEDDSYGGNVAQPDGGDIVFIDADRATKLDHEIEKYDPATGELVAWVEVRSLSSTNDTDIYIFYGNADAVNQWNLTGAGVWEPNYVGVWHLKETSGPHYDSTWNNNDSTSVSVSGQQGGDYGQINGSDNFDEASFNRIIIGGGSESLDIRNAITVEAWVAEDSMGGSHRIVNKNGKYCIRARWGDCIEGYINNGGTTATSTWEAPGTIDPITGHIALTWDNDAGAPDNYLHLYWNGVPYDTSDDEYTGTIDDYDGVDDQLDIGSHETGGEYFDGSIDEVRISKVARSAAWIETEHNNQKAGSTFYVIDDDWVGPCWDANYEYRRKIVITAGSADIPAGYSVCVTLNHAALVSDGKSLDSGDDLRVVHWDGESSTWTELDRALEPLSSWNDGSTQIWFALVDPIAASGSDGTYYLHYGYDLAGDPPDDWANVFMLGDDFNDGTLTAGMTSSTAGTASITESGGEAFIDLGTNEATDAGILVSTNALPDDKKFVIRHKTKVVLGGGASNPEVKAIGIYQLDTRPTVMASPGENNVRRITVYQRVDGLAQIFYTPAADTGVSWDDATSTWVSGWSNWGTLPIGTYYIYDLISNGTNWYVRVSNASGTVLTETDPVPWSSVWDDNSNPLWFYWGECYTNFYYADANSDWFYVRSYVDSEPASVLGGEEEGCRGEATAVSLLSFTAEGEGGSVLVEWETGQEVDNMGFNLYRACSPDGRFARLNDKLIPGSAFSAGGQSYSFVDSQVREGELYYFKLEDIDVYGKKRFHGPICVDWDGDGMPDDWELTHGLNPSVYDSWNDPDDDGLSNLQEYEWGTDPLNPDTDGDGILDGDEDGKVGRGDIGETRSLGKGVQVVAADENGVTLELRTEAYEMEIVEADGVAYQRLRILDYVHGLTQEVGKPELPVKGILLDVPDGASPSLSVETTVSQTYSDYRVYPVPENTVQGEEGMEYVGEVFAKDEAAYATDAFCPVDVAGLGQIFTFRDQQKLQILFHPLVFNPVSEELTHYTRIRVRVEYGVSQEESTTARSLSRAVSSPSVPRTVSRAVAWSPPASQGPVYKVFVSEEGIYRMSGSWLAANGINVVPDHVRLYNLGREVPIRVYDGGVAGQFDSGDYIEFYGEPVAGQYTKYAENNVYWLTDAGVSGGLRMGSMDGGLSGTQVPVSTHTSTVRYEEDRVYDNLAPGPGSLDRWFFDVYVTGAGYPVEHPYYGGVGTEFDMHLPDVAGHGSLTIALYAPFDLEHELEVSVNSTVRTFTWSGISYHEVRIDGVDLVEGLNTVTLRCNVASDGFLVDWFEATYPRDFVADNDMLKFSYDAGSAYQVSGFTTDDLLAFDVTTAMDVKQIVIPEPADMGGSYTLDMEPREGSGDRTYLVLSSTELKVPGGIGEVLDTDLASASNGADYILITHRDLGWDEDGNAQPWLSDLVALRQGQGLRVKVVGVEDIYNEFGYGIPTPQAIKDFLAHAYKNWTKPAPQYVLLVGDSTYDYKDNLDLGTINFVPAYLSWTEHMGEALTDDWFARVSGDDAIPDLYIGRLPAATVAHAATMVSKIVAYESTDNAKTWQKNTLLVADDQTEDYEALFEIMNNDVAALIPAGMNEPFTEYLADYAGNEPALNTAIKDKIRDGSLIVNYSGHGSVQTWAKYVFHVDDVAALDNEAPKYPFFVSMTCLNGHFGYPETEPRDVSLAEVLLRSENEGAVGAFMSTGRTAPEGQRVLDESFFDAVFTKDIRCVGPAISFAKQELLANGSVYEDVSKTFLLFGDPATKLKVPLPTVPAGVAAQSEDGSVVLSWLSAGDCDGNPVSGYNIYRSATAGGPYEKVNTELVTRTAFTDTSAASGTWYYVITSVDAAGAESVPSAELGVVAGSRTLSGGSAEGAGGGGGGCFIGTIAN